MRRFFASFLSFVGVLASAIVLVPACGASDHELLVAIRARDQARVDAYLRKHGPPNFRAEENGWSSTPLLQAVKVGSDENIRQLVSAGADPTYPDEAGVTPMAYACGQLKVNALQVMLTAGDDKGIAKRAGSSCLHAAHARFDQQKETEILRALAGAGFEVGSATPSNRWDGTTWSMLPFHGVVTQNKTEVAAAYLALGVPVDLRDAEGRTPLVYAVALNRFAGAKFLLANGADPSARDARGLDVRASANALAAGLPPKDRDRAVFDEALARPLDTPAERVAALETALAKHRVVWQRESAERVAAERRRKEAEQARAAEAEARRAERRRQEDAKRAADPDYGVPEICRTPEMRACRATGKSCEACFHASLKASLPPGGSSKSCTYQEESCGSDCCKSDYRCCVFDKGAGFVCRKKGESCGGWGWQAKADWQRGMP